MGVPFHRSTNNRMWNPPPAPRPKKKKVLIEPPYLRLPASIWAMVEDSGIENGCIGGGDVNKAHRRKGGRKGA